MGKSLILIIILSSFLSPIICLAAEQITITTYYPSPFGSYNSLEANNFQADRIAIGNGNTAADPTAANYVDDGVLDFIGLAANPTGDAGSIYYNSASNIFLYFDGTSWISMIPQAARLVAYVQDAAALHPCQPAGTHVVGVLTVALRGARMDFPPASGYIICH